MRVTELLNQCTVLGVTLTPGAEGTLRVSPPGILSPELRGQLKAHKPALLQVLTAPPADALSDDPCETCGSHERWQWLGGRALCRVCLILDFAPLTLRRGDI